MTNKSIFFVFLLSWSIKTFFTCEPSSPEILKDAQTLNEWLEKYFTFMSKSIPELQAYLKDPSIEGISQIQKQNLQFWTDIKKKNLLNDALKAFLPANQEPFLPPNLEQVIYKQFIELCSEVFPPKQPSPQQTYYFEPTASQLPTNPQERFWQRLLRLLSLCLPIARPYDDRDYYDGDYQEVKNL